ncbi:MAG TPA: ABC transporter substrate-binding protein [Kiloniellales bacterium]|nr:ABC transporter substrate-binding protein [Kiloniellales bacterium]
MSRTKSPCLSLLFAVLAALVPAGGRAGAAEAPRAVVERLNETLIEIMREAETLGFEGRYARLAPVLKETFDFPRMAAVAVGRTWRELDEAERQRLVEAFAGASIATFAERFDGYGGQRWEIGAVEPAPRNLVLVRNRLVEPDGSSVSINYLLRDAASDGGGDWRAVDVYLDAKYSELALKRSEYGAVIKNRGFEALLRELEAKAKRPRGGG